MSDFNGIYMMLHSVVCVGEVARWEEADVGEAVVESKTEGGAGEHNIGK